MNTPDSEHAPRLVLASRSPRRRLMLEQQGLAHRAVHPGVDDAELDMGAGGPVGWVMSLAYLKARAGLEEIIRDGKADPPSVVVGADTVCVHEGRVLGQPKDRDEARDMLRGFVGRTHQVLSGVAILAGGGPPRRLFADGATVRWGDPGDDQIEAYLDTDQWRGKAGGYNLFERLDACWPIEVEGDPDTVVGLPMRRLLGELEALGAIDAPPGPGQTDPAVPAR